MSHTITGAPAYSTTLTVPDGTDSGTVRAQNVSNDIAQKLLNNDTALKQTADGAVQKTGSNTITANNTFTGTNSFSNVTTFTGASNFNNTVTISAPLAVTGATTLATGGGGVITGSGTTTLGGNLDVNGNADVLGGDLRVLAGKLLVRDDCTIGTDSSGNLTVHGTITSDGTITSTGGGLSVNQNIVSTAGGLTVAGNLGCNGFSVVAGSAQFGSGGVTIATGGSLAVGGSIAITQPGNMTVTQGSLRLGATGEITYTNPPSTRWVNIDMSSGATNAPNEVHFDGVDWIPTVANPSHNIYFPLNFLPRGATLTNCQVFWKSADSGHANGGWIDRVAFDWTATSLTSGTYLPLGATVFQGTFGTSYIRDSLNTGNAVIDNLLYSYRVVIGLGSLTSNRVAAIRVGFTDPGARNG